MIEIPTVLVLGAGASAPYDFPCGRRFLDHVLRVLGREITNIKRDSPNGLAIPLHIPTDHLCEVYEALQRASQPSIDAFLDKRPQYSATGKMAIAMALIPYETLGLLEYGVNKTDSWYERLFQAMDAKPEDFSRNKLKIITFNYDRSLEYFLWRALQYSYGLEDTEAAQLLKTIPIVHVYGQLGLPHFSSTDGRDYSPEVTLAAVRTCMDSIKVVGDRVDDSEELKIAQGWIQEEGVQRVCFLGFGYHPENIRRLKIRDKYSGIILGSAYQLGLSEKMEAMHRLRSGADYITLYDGDVMSTLKQLPVLTDRLSWPILADPTRLL